MFAVPITFVIVSWITAALSIVLLGVEVWALINALRFPEAAYNAASKRSKGFWSLLTAGAALCGVFSAMGSFFGASAAPGLLQIVAIVIAGVFLADVLPALRTVMGNAQGRYRR